MTTPQLLISRPGADDLGVLLVRLNRPERRNAITAEMYAGLADALTEADADDSVRVVVISGEGGHFTAGNDLVDFQSAPPTLDDDSPVIRFLRALATFRKPLVAAVEGAAIGVGTTLLLHCDLVVVSRSASLKMPFVSLGLVPEAGASLLLPRLVGHLKAAELLMLSEPVKGEEVLRLGLANRLAEPLCALPEALHLAGRLADQPLGSLILTKQLLRAPIKDALAETMMTEGALFFERLGSPEAAEAFVAFFEKRKPDFRRATG